MSEQKPEYEIYGAEKEDWEAMTLDERNLTRVYYERDKLLQQVAELTKENERLQEKVKQYDGHTINSYKSERIKALTEQVEKLKNKIKEDYDFYVIAGVLPGTVTDDIVKIQEEELSRLREREKELVEALRIALRDLEAVYIYCTSMSTIQSLLSKFEAPNV